LLRSIGVGEALPQLALARLEVLLALGDLVFEERKREVELPQLRRELIVMRLHRVDRLRRGRDLGLDRRLVRVDLVELGRRIVDGTLRGFLVGDFASQREEFFRDVSGWIRESRIKYREDVVDGLEQAPEAFIGLLKGRNFGKMLVKVWFGTGVRALPA